MKSETDFNVAVKKFFRINNPETEYGFDDAGDPIFTESGALALLELADNFRQQWGYSEIIDRETAAVIVQEIAAEHLRRTLPRLFVGGYDIYLRPGIKITAEMAAYKPVWAHIAGQKVLVMREFRGPEYVIDQQTIDMLMARADRQRSIAVDAGILVKADIIEDGGSWGYKVFLWTIETPDGRLRLTTHYADADQGKGWSKPPIGRTVAIVDKMPSGDTPWGPGIRHEWVIPPQVAIIFDGQTFGSRSCRGFYSPNGLPEEIVDALMAGILPDGTNPKFPGVDIIFPGMLQDRQ